MSITGYRRLTVALAALVLCLAALLLPLLRRQMVQTADIRDTCAVINGFEMTKASAMRSSNADYVGTCLSSVLMYRTNAFSSDLKGLQHVYLRERSRAAKDILAHLRTLGGTDYGDDPEVWFQHLSPEHH